jgi:hypothetical protein
MRFIKFIRKITAGIFTWKITAGDIFIVAMIPVLVCFFGFQAAVSSKGLGSGEAASWVQAGGSIVAILSAVALAWWQHDQSLSRQVQQEQDRREKAVHLARLALGLISDAIDDLVWVADNADFNGIRTGMLERIRDQRSLLAGMNLIDLSPDQSAAIIKLRDGCSAMIALLLRPGIGVMMHDRAEMQEMSKVLHKDIVVAVSEFDSI